MRAWLKSIQNNIDFNKIKQHWGSKALIVLLVIWVLFSISIPRFSSKVSNEAGFLARKDAALEATAPQMAKVAGGMADTAMSSPATASEEVASPNIPSPVNMIATTNATLLYKPQIIKTANTVIRVENIVTAMKTLEASTVQLGGIITDQNVTITGPNDSFRQGSLTIRIPQELLNTFLEKLSAIGTVLTQTISGKDVGMEMVDTEARVKNLRGEESALQLLMNRAGKIPDILEVEHELSRVRGEIEQSQGRLNYLRQQVAYSTVSITLTEQSLNTPTQGKPSLGTVLMNSIQSALGSLYDLCIWIVQLLVWLCLNLLPRILLLGLLLGLLWKSGTFIRTRFRKKNN